MKKIVFLLFEKYTHTHTHTHTHTFVLRRRTQTQFRQMSVFKCQCAKMDSTRDTPALRVGSGGRRRSSMGQPYPNWDRRC